MTTKTARKGRAAGRVYGLKALTGAGVLPGTFEAIVAVFGNVDFGGDRIVAGAFGKSLTAWASSGDPIPCIFSHQWDDLDAHVGVVLEAKELLPGDALLPPELMANGGLWTKFRLDVEEDFAGRLAKRLEERRIKEFSFAYDVGLEKRASDGANDLLELDLIEVGPTLKGMNPATVLMAKSEGDEALERLRSEFVAGVAGTLRDLGAPELADTLAKGIVPHAFAAGDDPARCVLCGLTRNTVGHNTSAAGPGGAKAYVLLTGSVEERQEAVYEAAYAWAREGNIGDGGFYSAYLEATFDDRAVVLVEGWNDPCGEGEFFELPYTIDAAGEVVLGDAQMVALETTAVAKSRSMKHRTLPGSALAGAKAGIVPPEPTGKAKGKGDEPEDPDPRTGEGNQALGTDPALVELDLLEASLD